MDAASGRWQEIAPSAFPWEREALDFVRTRLPDHDPYLAWSNFEFVGQDGSINEIDLLALSPNGLFLIEVKSRPGEVAGDANTWTWNNEGRVQTTDNPVLLANRKAQRLASLLKAQKAFNQTRPPFIEPVVFLSAPSLKVRLDERGRRRVYQRDEPGREGQPARPGIVALLTDPPNAAGPRSRVDRLTARAVAQALQQIGIRPTQASRKVGDFILGGLLYEGPGYQDWDATHAAAKEIHRRVRLYPVALGTTKLSRRTIERAAQREFQILEGIRHPGILQAVNYTLHERGPALVFEHDRDSVRLDHFLRDRGPQLTVDARLGVLRQIAEALKHAHQRHLYHRALSPHSILVSDVNAAVPRVRIFNWQTGRRDPSTSAASGAQATRTTHLGELVEEAARVYMAPEALRSPDSDAGPMDVFSLGALAYHLFAGKPPAETVVDLTERLREDRGLEISVVLDGAGPELEQLIHFSTAAEVSSRTESVADFLNGLDRVEDELTAPTRVDLPDPLEAKAGETIDGGFLVKRRLGKGSSAVALLVERGGREDVLKVALGPEHHDRLRVEGEILAQIRHQHVCAFHELLEVGGHLALRMDRAGDETLGHRLRTEGPLTVEMLLRFGEDLLGTLDSLEQQGIAHRDVKPENIGVTKVGPEKRLHLVLFDFSLSRVPAENYRAGTVPYLDPFIQLRKPPRWDLHAERFAAAMTLHEMATGSLPVWGDGRSDPAMVEDEVTIESGRFDPDLREALAAFFEKALARDYRKRFENTLEVKRAWQDVFRQAERKPETDVDNILLGEALASARPDTPLAQLGLGTRALNALERAAVTDVRGLLQLPPLAVNQMRGVGSKTRREITLVLQRLTARLGPEVPKAPPSPAQPDDPLTIEAIADRLVPRTKGHGATQADTLRRLLGLHEAVTPGWPSQTDVAAVLGITRARVGQIVAKARQQWAGDLEIEALTSEAADLLALRGGVMTVPELTAAILAARTSLRADPERTRLASAVARAIVEAEQAREEPRFALSRAGGVLLVAASDALADYALRLGAEADHLAAEDPLPTPARVTERLQRLGVPAGSDPLAASRLIPLAAAASKTAAVSGRLELYPRGMPALAALKLAHSGLSGVPTLTPAQLAERLQARFPEAEPPPGRPTLDELLAQAGYSLVWDNEEGVYRAPKATLLTSATPSLPRAKTTLTRTVEVTPEIAEARQFHARLQHAWRDGGFLALTAEPRYLQRAEKELRGQFDLVRLNLEEALIHAMREEALRAGASWDIVRRADVAARDSGDWGRLIQLVRRTLPRVEAQILDTPGRVLLVNPGLLARYGQVDVLARLGAALERRITLQALWVLVPADASNALPVLDGQAVPVITRGQWARIPEPWLQNLHRGNLAAAAGATS